ncbi:hypothetical protein BGZ60DRAFT_402469 [Tricladium varicosporioides]|nr:hypothetical protein BGZ60DRAFT_402469 [Hymenoscyphus varicosporioides]
MCKLGTGKTIYWGTRKGHGLVVSLKNFSTRYQRLSFCTASLQGSSSPLVIPHGV